MQALDRTARRAFTIAMLSVVGVLLIPVDHARGSTDSDSAVVVRLNTAVPHTSVDAGSESELLQLMNDARAERGLPRLSMDASLRFVARGHSTDMATHGYVGHGTLAGISFLQRLAPVVRHGLVGENVTLAQTVEEANTIFLASAGHLHNIMNPAFHRVGIGVAVAGPAGVAVTEDFAE
ncbi:MAG TPA: CAP domain-containing protein [bacterium]|nr:CAP domain-containing protein [bacterium]